MGKYKSRRYKMHASAPSKKPEKSIDASSTESPTKVSAPALEDNVFAGIDILSLMKDTPENTLDDDIRSVKSYVSSKSLKGENVIPKKEKRKLKRQFLLKKIDTLNQMKKELKQKQKGKEQKAPINTMQNLLDSLPVLEPSVSNSNTKQSHHIGVKKKKAIERSKKIQKKTIQNINIYQKLLKNPALAKDPFATISEHLKAVVEKERKANVEPKNFVQKKRTK